MSHVVLRRLGSLAAAVVLPILGLAGASPAVAQVTTVTITSDTVQRGIKRLGINLGSRNRWGDAQILKNLIENPGFEAGEYGSVILADSGSTGTALYQALVSPSNNGNAQPAGFWDGAEYEIVWGAAKGRAGRVRAFQQQNGRYLFQLDNSGAVPGRMDVVLVRQRVPGIYGNTTIADTTTTRPGSAGRQSMKMNAANARFDFYMDSYWRDGDRSAGKFLPVSGRWHMEIWAKGRTGTETLHAQFFREGTAPFIDQRAALTTEWRKYEWDVDVPTTADPNRPYGANEYRPILDARIETGAADQEIWVDDVVLARASDINTTVFADAFVERLRELNPGIVRDWSTQFGSTLDAQLAPAEGRPTSGSRSDARVPGSHGYGLHEFLELAATLGAEPWYVVPPSFSPADLTNLVEYLAAPSGAGHAYADRRAALGHPEPWTSTFPTIHLEYGNELWGSARTDDPFQGASVSGGVRLGAVASDRFAIIRASQFFQANRFNLIIGGQAGFPGRQAEIEANATQHDAVALAPYFGTLDVFDADSVIFAPLLATPFYQAGPTGGMHQSRGYIDAGGHGTNLAIYEINFHTTSGAAPIDIRNDFLTSQVGGVALPLTMLTYQRELGAIDQCAFSALGYSFRMANGDYARVWGMLRDLYASGRKRPTWLGLELANQAILPNAVATRQNGANPAWSQPAINGIGAATQVNAIQSFAYAGGGRRSVILFNLSLTTAHPVELELPAVPTAYAGILQLLGGLHDDNEDSATVRIGSTAISDFRQGYALQLPPHSITAITWEDATTTGVKSEDVRAGNMLEVVSNGSAHDAVARYTLARGGNTRLELVDITGRVVRVLASGDAGAGSHEIAIWQGLRPASGTYLLRLSCEGITRVCPVMVAQ